MNRTEALATLQAHLDRCGDGHTHTEDEVLDYAAEVVDYLGDEEDDSEVDEAVRALA